jgi:hypothetical protein
MIMPWVTLTLVLFPLVFVIVLAIRIILQTLLTKHKNKA